MNVETFSDSLMHIQKLRNCICISVMILECLHTTWVVIRDRILLDSLSLSPGLFVSPLPFTEHKYFPVSLSRSHYGSHLPLCK
jgi:hypothetical protein